MTHENWLACDMADYETRTFATREEAEKWISERSNDGDDNVTEEAESGRNYIAKIVARTAYKVINRRDDPEYKCLLRDTELAACEDCAEIDCEGVGDVWPDAAADTMGEVVLEEVKS